MTSPNNGCEGGEGALRDELLRRRLTIVRLDVVKYWEKKKICIPQV